METIKLLEEIRNDFVGKNDGDPTIKRVCNVMINEYKSRSKDINIPLLDKADFHNLMSDYRHAPISDQEKVVDKFEAVKDWIRKNYKEL
jgi:hypothetical protein